MQSSAADPFPALETHVSSLSKGSNSSSQKPELCFQKESAVELSKFDAVQDGWKKRGRKGGKKGEPSLTRARAGGEALTKALEAGWKRQ